MVMWTVKINFSRDGQSISIRPWLSLYFDVSECFMLYFSNGGDWGVKWGNSVLLLVVDTACKKTLMVHIADEINTNRLIPKIILSTGGDPCRKLSTNLTQANSDATIGISFDDRKQGKEELSPMPRIFK